MQYCNTMQYSIVKICNVLSTHAHSAAEVDLDGQQHDHDTDPGKDRRPAHMPSVAHTPPDRYSLVKFRHMFALKRHYVKMYAFVLFIFIFAFI